MSRPRFSKEYRTYGEWLKAMPRDTRYAKEIIRKHKLNPSATLSTLRKMRVSDVSPALKAYAMLSPEEVDMRSRALLALSDLRKGKNLTLAAKQQGISLKDALRHLGNAVFKKNGKWVATKTDSIERGRWIYSNGKRISVVVNSSRDGSLISRYLAIVKIAVKNGDKNLLEPFKDVKIRGVDGKEYSLETDLDKLYELKEQVEDSESLPVYDNRI
ncbi:hypothetical protein [Methanolobus bombayensis]|uniref:hypothetical protein n=1 Tax=Methanolobus bombayensis TaxID=38023 RepID=UPI001AE20C56|nr:hypothetical protein [Methanolobus bombayensis]MBP1908439.1 hypothetical protein [Methanolobus bombayensis]